MMVSKAEKLRKLTRMNASRNDYEAWCKQVDGESNDRGACLLLAANVEAGLDAAIEQTFLWKDEIPSDLYFDDGPLANFSRKIALGFVLKIYREGTKSNLDIIRKVRNAFAHAKQPIRFDTAEVADICADLERIRPVPPHVVKSDYLSKEGLSPRQLFQNVCDVTAHNLFVYSLNPVIEIGAESLKTAVPKGYERIIAQRVSLP
jgi:hypothetical protein